MYFKAFRLDDRRSIVSPGSAKGGAAGGYPRKFPRTDDACTPQENFFIFFEKRTFTIRKLVNQTVVWLPFPVDEPCRPDLKSTLLKRGTPDEQN